MDPYVAVAETHISVVFFAGDRAFKLLKPIAMPFLDYSTVERRLVNVAQELQLNQRMAPDVYLGTADVDEGKVVTDRMLVMRRMPTDRRLPLVLKTPQAADELRSIARRADRRRVRTLGALAFHNASPLHAFHNAPPGRAASRTPRARRRWSSP